MKILLRVLVPFAWTAVVAAADIQPANAPTREAASEAMLARVFSSIVRIEAVRMLPNDGRLMKQWTGGSGAILTPDGYVVTNCHVTENGDYFRCYLYDGTHLEARLVGQDPLTDLAVIRMDLAQRAKGAPALQPARFGDSDKLVAGEPVYALGCPGFLAQSATRGVVSNPSFVLPEQTAGKMILRGEDVGTLVRWVLHDARIFGGNSGGPLVNARGEIVGINEISVFNLSGAIPGNLAGAISKRLIAGGKVKRGWSGLTVQRRLEADADGSGVVVADVAPGSPAAGGGLRPGDVIVACDGHPIEDQEEKAVSHYYRLETSRMPGEAFVVDYLRGAARLTVRLTLTERAEVQSDDEELRNWGAIARDITPQLARTESLPDTNGVWLESVRPSGPCGQAEPELRRQDVLVAVEGQAVHSLAELREVTAKLVAGATDGTKSVLASVRRDGAVLSSVVELRVLPERNLTPQVRKAWLGVSSQPLLPKLGARLGIKGEGGVRLTRIFPNTQAAAAGLQVGDVLVALDGDSIPARRAEDADLLAQQIRRYRVGTQAVITLWRDGRKLDVPVTLEAQPTPSAEMPWWEDLSLEFSVRDPSFDDRMRLQLPDDAQGVLVESAVPAGWANLAGLRNDDLIMAANGAPITSTAGLRAARDAATQKGDHWLVLLVRRRAQTLLVEINLNPAKKP
ncbi:MAG TPA: PDZ domain-containing protein [Lacunisphaera sp.]|nr:PDZ domain-containing protein [Lacunisphaera sp.]